MKTARERGRRRYPAHVRWLNLLLILLVVCTGCASDAAEDGAASPETGQIATELQQGADKTAEDADNAVTGGSGKEPAATSGGKGAKPDSPVPTAGAANAAKTTSTPQPQSAPHAPRAGAAGAEKTDATASPPVAAPSCTLSIDCKTVLSHMDQLDATKVSIIPEKGVLLGARKVPFEEGETVFDILKRVMADRKIHMSFVKTPVLNSYYVEAIGNLYEFDAGSLSGWLYSVNGETPGTGSSDYKLKDGDVVRWMYTCEQGKDL